MSLVKLYRWFLGLAILANVISFSGFTESVKLAIPENIEWVCQDTQVELQNHFYFTNGLYQTDLIYHVYLFEFNSLLNNYNSVVSLQFKTTNFESLQSVEDLFFEALLNTGKSDDYTISS